ncbi:ATP-binding protein [Vulcanisaeta thermophila]|uniref:ATP-binding protein n=1 Tax=Vulcanisaeta thermophila TaxID=867917 RepID=UPI000852D8CD|nr:ATP-binding protein [Vulcanisaeta thermophila]
MKRIRLRFAGQEVEFVDREVAIKQIEELADKGTWWPLVIYGPEGCGKSALFKQAVEVLRDHGYEVSYINPLSRSEGDRVILTEGLRRLLVDLGSLVIGDAAKLIDTAIELLYNAVRKGLTRKIALLADDVFQAIGLDKAEQLVKGLLNMIEYPSVNYEKIVVLISSSEGTTREKIGRHRWAEIMITWNMTKEGLEKLYNQIPEPKPPFEEVWRWTGGNPEMLEKLYKNHWDVNKVIEEVRLSRGINRRFTEKWRKHLEKTVEDPDYLWTTPEAELDKLIKELVEKNLIIEIWKRHPYLWIDTPPPEKDPELGIGTYYAWQTPIHREAIKRTLEETK